MSRSLLLENKVPRQMTRALQEGACIPASEVRMDMYIPCLWIIEAHYIFSYYQNSEELI